MHNFFVEFCVQIAAVLHEMMSIISLDIKMVLLPLPTQVMSDGRILLIITTMKE